MAMHANELEKELMQAHEIKEDITKPRLWRVLAMVGRRLEKDPSDNYALEHATAAILNLVYEDETNGGHRYEKYYPKYTQDSKKERKKDGVKAKAGEVKKINFTAEFHCQKPNKKHLRVFKTKNGVVVADKYVCGKAWTCPVCGAKISQRRNEEINKILNKAYGEKKSVFLVTFTAPHTSKNRILSFSKKLQKAYQDFWDSYGWKLNKKTYKLFGYIKSMETMLGGVNGAHNHFHVILIFDSDFSGDFGEKILHDLIIKQWEKSCIKYGLLNKADGKQVKYFIEHAINVKRDFDKNYIAKQSTEWQKEHGVSAKWGAAEEITLGKQKKGQGSYTPLGYVATICRKADAGGYNTYADLLSDCEPFIEYACAMSGRKQYLFSRGLREWAGLDEEKTDKELAEEMQDEGNLIGGFDEEQYNFIRRNFMWKPLKKALHEDTEKAVSVLNKVFAKNGLCPFYSKNEIKALTAENCWFSAVSKAYAAGG